LASAGGKVKRGGECFAAPEASMKALDLALGIRWR